MTATWVTEGFDAFRRGKFGNAGQNLYVSRAGILQRIHLFDLNRDGWSEVLFCNSHEHHESPPALLYVQPLLGKDGACVELPAAGAVTAAVADLHGDGHDDLVLGNEQDGVDPLLNSYVYFGSKDGLSERFHQRLPAPACTGVAIGDFNGDGKLDIAMATQGKLRLFLQTPVGFEPLRHIELPVGALDVFAADFDGDGFADLYVRDEQGHGCVYWGGPDGIESQRRLVLPSEWRGEAKVVWGNTSVEAPNTVLPRVQAIRWQDRWWLVVMQPQRLALLEVTSRRQLGRVTQFACNCPVAVGLGDIDGDGLPELVIATQDHGTLVYFQRDGQFEVQHRVVLPTLAASDVAVVDLDGDGCCEIAVSQYASEDQYSIESLIFRGQRGGIDMHPVRLPTHGARRVLPIRLSGQPQPSLVFVQQFARERLGKIDAVLYLGGPDGFKSDRQIRFAGLSAINGVGADYNDDGLADLLLINCAENAPQLDCGSYLYLQGEQGFAREPSQLIPTRNAMGVVVADINRDGYLDLIVQSYSQPELLIFMGTKDGFDVQHPVRIPMIDEGKPLLDGRRCCLADLNNDGWLDLVVTFNGTDRCYVLWGGPDGFDFNRRQTLSVINSSCPVVADLDGDGYLDLIIGGHKTHDCVPHTSFVYIYWNGPDGLREDRRTILPAQTVLGIAVADFNGDGRLDLYVSNYSSARARDVDSYMYWADENGQFSANRRTLVRNHSAAGCLAADFNNDGRVDLAVANHKTEGDHIGESYIYWNGPGGMDWTNPTRLPTRGPHGLMFTQPGNQADRSDLEHYLSEPRQSSGRPTTIAWDADLAPGTWVEAHLRSAASPEALSQAPWQGRVDGNALQCGDRLDHLPDGGPWWQYRLGLGARQSGGTPRLRQVTIQISPAPRGSLRR